MREPKEGELYDLKDGHGWCRHGLVKIHAHSRHGLIAADTYWGGPRFGAFEDNWHLVDKVRDRLTFILDLNNARDSHKDEWEVYADEDRAYIPQGGNGARWYVRKDARPNYPRQVARLEGLIRQERSRAESSTRWADGYEKELQALRDAHVHRPSVQGPCAIPDCSICKDALKT